MLLSIQPSTLLAIAIAWGHCWFVFSLLCVWTPMSSSAVFLSSLLIPVIQFLCYTVCLCFRQRWPFFKQAEKLWNYMTIDTLVAYILYSTFMFLPSSLVPLGCEEYLRKRAGKYKVASQSVSGRSQIVHPFISITKNNTLFSQSHFRNWW